jgi:hypothetical protein
VVNRCRASRARPLWQAARADRWIGIAMTVAGARPALNNMAARSTVATEDIMAAGGAAGGAKAAGSTERPGGPVRAGCEHGCLIR